MNSFPASVRFTPGIASAAFVREFAAKFQKPVEGVSLTAERLLMMADWPGNVRELKNVLERACMLAEGRCLTERDVERCLPAAPPRAASAPSASSSGTDLRSLERQHILKVLHEERGNKRAAAAKLGLSRRTLYRRLERHDITT